MKNFFFGLVVGVLACILTAGIFVFAAIRLAGSLSERTASVEDGSTLVMRLQDDLPEKSTPEIPLPLFEDQAPLTVADIWETLHRAAADSRVKGILLEPRSLGIGWAKLEEIRQEILQFKKSGKPVVAFLQSPGSREYYLAAAADRVFLPPEDELDLKGLRVESMYFKSTLDKLGVKFDVIHAGKYKDAGDILTGTSMSPETREVLNNILDQYYGDLVSTIAQDRKKQAEEVKTIIDDGPFLASDAFSRGLVDSLGYEDQAVENLKNRLQQNELKRISIRTYLKARSNQTGGHRIALVVGQGEISRGSGNESANDQAFSSTAFVKLLKQVGDDSSIQAVILRVDSPGGDGVASDEILHEAKNLSKKKPLVISMSDLAASGGYFVAMTGDPVVAYPNTLTGSIGVIFARLNLQGLYQKIGVNKQLLTRGRFADIDSEYAQLTDAERQKITAEIDGFYRAFVDRVAQGRKRTFEQIEPLAQGRVWLGAQAKQNGLVDELGGLDRAVELIRQRAHFGATDRVTLVPYPAKRSIFDVLYSRPDDSAEIESRVAKIFGQIPVTALAQGGFMKLMPYSISVK